MDKHYTYGILDGNHLTLFNESTVSSSVLSSDFLEDVTVELSPETGILYITAKKIEYDLYIHDKVFEDEWDHTPENRLIHEGKRWPWSKKKERYVKGGWVRTIERTLVSYILNDYKIEILD